MQKNKRGFTAINGGGSGSQEREQERARERERKQRADEEMDKLILQAMQTFMIRVADAEQRAFIKNNWHMAHGIIRQCIACGVLEGLDAQIALAQFISNNF